jgi:hypothetical protein
VEGDLRLHAAGDLEADLRRNTGSHRTTRTGMWRGDCSVRARTEALARYTAIADIGTTRLA